MKRVLIWLTVICIASAIGLSLYSIVSIVSLYLLCTVGFGVICGVVGFIPGLYKKLPKKVQSALKALIVLAIIAVTISLIVTSFRQ